MVLHRYASPYVDRSSLCMLIKTAFMLVAVAFIPIAAAFMLIEAAFMLIEAAFTTVLAASLSGEAMDRTIVYILAVLSRSLNFSR